jgi:hypothetical protein
LDGSLGQLSKALEGVKFTFPILDNEMVCSTILKQPKIDFFCTGRVSFNGRVLSGIYTADGYAPDQPLLPVEQMEYRWVGIGKFLSQKRIYHRGTFVTCKQVISFMANKLGGVHIDESRSEETAALEEASQFLTLGPMLEQPPHGDKSVHHIVVEPHGRHIWHCFHVELMAAVTAFINMKVDDEPAYHINVRPTWRARLRKLLGRQEYKNLLIFESDGGETAQSDS